MLLRKGMTRREFLRLAGASSAALMVAACAKPTPAPTATPEPTAAPTAAPAKAEEKATTAPTPKPTLQPTAETGTGFDVESFVDYFEPAPASFYAYDDMSENHKIEWMRGSWYQVGMCPDKDPVKMYFDKTMNVDFIHNPSAQGVYQELNLRIASGEGAPDVWMDVSQFDAKKLAKDGVAIGNLMPYAEQYLYNYWQLLDLIAPKAEVLKPGMDHGNLFAMVRPTWTGEPGNALFVRQSWMDSLGLSEPKTTEDFYNMCVALQKGASQMDGAYGLYPGPVTRDGDPLGGGFNWLSFFYGSPPGLFMEGKTVSMGWLLPSRKDFLTYVKRFVDEKLVPDDWYLQEGTQGWERAWKADYGATLLGAWGLQTQGSKLGDTFFDYSFVPWLEGPAGRRTRFRGMGYAEIQLNAELLKNEAKMKRIWHIYDQLADPLSCLSKACNLAPYKCEDFEYPLCTVNEYIENGPYLTIVLADRPNPVKENCPPGMADDENCAKCIGEWRPFAVSVWTKMAYSVPGKGRLYDQQFGEDERFHMAHPTHGYYAWWAKLEGEQFYTPVEMKGDSAAYADLRTLINTNELQFVMGQRPLSEWDAYVQEAMTTYKAKELLETTVQVLQEDGEDVTGIDARLSY